MGQSFSLIILYALQMKDKFVGFIDIYRQRYDTEIASEGNMKYINITTNILEKKF